VKKPQQGRDLSEIIRMSQEYRIDHERKMTLKHQILDERRKRLELEREKE
jgi:hypothetical protein